MKYFGLNTVVSSYQGFQNCMTNKSWGYLALLKGCKNIIHPFTPYEVNMNNVSNFLEDIFNLSQSKRNYDSLRSLYVVYSNKWNHYFNDQGKHVPNIYDVIVWAYRRKSFSDSFTKEDLINDFSKEFNIPYYIIKDCFDINTKNIQFTNTLYSETALKSALGQIGVDVSKNNIDAKADGVVASPGEISRGPFIQTLYAGLDITDYVLILQSNYNSLYGGNALSDTSHPSVILKKSSLQNSFLNAIRTKPFLLLAGISGTGKSRIVRELAFKSCPVYLQDKDGATPGNYCMIEVKPNWHDSTELLGYYSNMNKSYQFKKFVKFLVKAKMFPDVPFFVCLDEMNLAPVEHYFAEILSIMETRKHPKIEGTDEVNMNIIKTGTIVDAEYFREYASLTDKNGNKYNNLKNDRDIYMKLHGIDTENDIKEEDGKRTDLTTEGLTLPDNVIIIGTVNMDDTTHQFSRKVIDRAMTIEMNGGNLINMFGGSQDLEYLPKEEQEKWQQAFRQRYVNADEVLKAHPEERDDIIKKVTEALESVNKALKGTPFEVSYRVLNELTIMLGVLLDNKEDEKTLDDVIAQALDSILLMKILPRIEGDSDMFNLSRDFKQNNQIEYNNRLEWLLNLAPDIKAEEQEDCEYRQTAREKIKEMIERLNNQEFTRFWP